MKGEVMSRLGLPFYGLTLTPEDKFRIHQEIFHLVYNANGGFTHDEIYSMPVFLRYFNIKMLIEQKDREAKQSSDSRGEDGPSSTPRVAPKPTISKK
jgi:hypothetical protein